MVNKSISTRPLTENEKLMREKFYESLVAQSDLMDKLGTQLLTIELAVPGLYATVLKLIHGDEATLNISWLLIVTFACWLAALVMTLIAFTPKKWKVDVTVLKQDEKKFDEGLGIEDFFSRSASYKRNWIVASSVLFFIGIFAAVFTL